MAEGHVIGVDLGGTKLLAGAVGSDLSVIHRTNRPVLGLTQDQLVQMAWAGELEGGLTAAPQWHLDWVSRHPELMRPALVDFTGA